MNVRNQIISQINQINSPEALQAILNMIQVEQNDEKLYNLNSKERESINEGLDDLKTGRTISQEESEKFFKEWFAKK
jgi:predicted transcriptional regulator